jgi:2-polyprenyl-3-methyl-5-hydroxy-6-metoxy-1,4-benzoquinol methylase
MMPFMRLSEWLLFRLAKLLYRSEAAHSSEMKRALSSRSECHCYRRAQLDTVLAAAKKYSVDFVGKTVLDLGCNDGAISIGFLESGASEVIGVDIDAEAIERARINNRRDGVSYFVGGTDRLPIPNESVEIILCYDVFEHVSQPDAILKECRRVLKPGGKMLIGTWGWYHPYAPHLWSTMPVPWAHIFFSEKTLLRVCRRVYESSWYVPNMYDLDEEGKKRPDKYRAEAISSDYLNKFLIRDFEKSFADSGLEFQVFLQPFGSKYARWTRCLLGVPWIREFVTGYFWVVLSATKRTADCVQA